MRHRPATMVAFALLLLSTGAAVRRRAEGLHSRSGRVADLRHHRSGAGHGVRQARRVSGPGRRASSGAIRTSRGSSRRSAAARRMTLGGPNLGQIVVTLKPRSERQRIGRARSSSGCGRRSIRSSACWSYLQNPPTIRIGSQVSKSLYQYSMQSPDKTALYATARKLKSALAELPGLQDVTSDLQITSPQVSVDIDRDKAAALGVTANQIESAFYDAYGPRWVSTIYGVGQRVQGAARARAGVPAGSERAVAAVLQGRRREQRGRAARHAGDASSSRSDRRPSITTASCRPSPSRSGSRRARRSATS